MKLLVVFLFSIIVTLNGCITSDPDIRPPLMDDTDFSEFEKPIIATNWVTTNISVIVSDPK